MNYFKNETFDEYYARFITKIGPLIYISNAQKISLIKRNLDKRFTFKILSDTFKTFHKFVSIIRRINITLTITEKVNPKERDSRENKKKKKKKISISFLIFANTSTTSTNTDFNINESDKLYLKHV
jgi:hypothetical protein